MSRLIQIAHAALLLSATGLCLMGAMFFWHLDVALKGAEAQLSADSEEVSADLNQLNVAIQEVNRPCGGKQACGTLADVAKTLNTLRGTAGQVEVAANHENERLGTMDAQEEQLVGDTHAVLVSAKADMESLDDTLRGAQPIEKGLAGEVADLRKATMQLTALESDQNITAMVASLNSAATNIAGVTANANQITADAAAEVHALMHPPKKTFWQAVFAVVHAAEPPIF